MPVERCLSLAARQQGVVTSAQLASAGFSRHAVANRAARGWLRRVHRGVYLVGPLETPWTLAMAAVLAYGEGALLSHHPAAVLLSIRQPPVGPLHVTVPGRDVRGRDGIRVHTVARLTPPTRRGGMASGHVTRARPARPRGPRLTAGRRPCGRRGARPPPRDRPHPQ